MPDISEHIHRGAQQVFYTLDMCLDISHICKPSNNVWFWTDCFLLSPPLLFHRTLAGWLAGWLNAHLDDSFANNRASS